MAPLSLAEYARYSRQLLLPAPGFHGIDAQVRLKNAHVLIVGAGGLGCPALAHLAAAGVGRLTVIDPDVVEVSNLARQFLHTDDGAAHAQGKAASAADAAHRINPLIDVVPIDAALTPANALDLVARADVVLDCTDNPRIRYLISDAAVLARTPVVSGAAQGVDGQVVVLNKALGPDPLTTTDRGPCYRCLFPNAPRPEEVHNCSDGGVLGVITGLVGTLQALEAIKLLCGIGEDPYAPPTLLLVSPLSVSTAPFRTIKLRPRRIKTCRACGDPSLLAPGSRITSLQDEDYISFCGLNRPSPDAERVLAQIDVKSFASRHAQRDQGPAPSKSGNTFVAPIRHVASSSAMTPASSQETSAPTQVAGPSTSTYPSHSAQQPKPAPPILIDVRPPHEYSIAHLATSHNVPLAKIRRVHARFRRRLDSTRSAGQNQGPAQAQRGQDAVEMDDVWDELGLRRGVGQSQGHQGQGEDGQGQGQGQDGVVREIHVLCRRGNDSLEAVRLLTDLVRLSNPSSDADSGAEAASRVAESASPPGPDVIDPGPAIYNVTGGLHAYAKEVDASFPVY